MPQEYYILPVPSGDGGEIDNTLPGGGISPGRPTPPIVLPPLPPTTKPPVGVWPPHIPPGHVSPPIYIPETPDNTLPPELPPGSVWPPVDPGFGVGGKILALVWLVGIGYRWAVLNLPSVWPPMQPPVAQPK